MTETVARVSALPPALNGAPRTVAAGTQEFTAGFFVLYAYTAPRLTPAFLVPKQTGNLVNKKRKGRENPNSASARKGRPASRQRLNGWTAASLPGEQVFRPQRIW